MQFGLFSNGERENRVAWRSYEEDIAEIVAADRLGFDEVWISEHAGGNKPDSVVNAEHLICKAAALTKHIRMGPGIRPLPLYHPIQVAAEAASCDHLTGGRYMAGFGGQSGGGGVNQAMAQRGYTPGDLRARMREAVDFIVKCWTTPEPFDYEGQFWQGKRIRISPKPLQKPHMPIGLACSQTDSTLELAGELGLLPLISFVNGPSAMRHMTSVFADSARAAGRDAVRHEIRIPRYIHVSSSSKKARAEALEVLWPPIELHRREQPMHFDRILPPSGKIDDVTLDYLVDIGVAFVGDPDQIYEGIKALYDEVGGFGVLLFMAGKDFGSLQQRSRSWRLFMKHVAPRLAELKPDRVAPGG